jgi:hypothetical protein
MARAVAILLAVAVIASGSAAQPCAMHQHAGGHGAEVMAAHDTGDACHTDAAPSCAAGGTCPAGGPVAPLAARPALLAPGLGADAPFTIDPAPHSFFSTPLPPPPQV